MGESKSFEELREDYVSFLREDRYQLSARIVDAIDEHNYGKSTGATGTGTGTGSHYARVTFSMAELRSYKDLAERLRRDPLRHIRALEEACKTIAEEERGAFRDKEVIKVAFTGPVGATAASPRQLTSSNLRQLVCVEGVATKVSTIKPKVVQSVHYCPTTKKHLKREYVDATDPNLGLPKIDSSGRELPDRFVTITSSVFPTKDDDNNPLETEFGLSTFKDHQTITLQEMPEKAPMGQLPRSIELILDHDLVDKVKPGDRVMIVGVYRALATASQGQKTSSGVFRTVILVNNVQILGRDVSQLVFQERDVKSIKALGKRSDILNILGRSISPSIHGHEIIKKALALQLLSGVEKNLDNKTHLRGDINILMVGDPSTAKSQLLRSAMTIAPLAVSTTGKGSSGVGLTAAVTSDPDTKERRLEAGAMVLADRGLVCVDEFDKMGENDRVAIHEAMEQQTVTIAKAGIHATLNARCSVLAAANPVYGQYDRQRRIQENIGLPDSLLSRFDLLFVVLDQMDPETDRRIASHVVRGHRTRGVDIDEQVDDDGEETAEYSIWQRNRSASLSADGDDFEDETDPHANDFLTLDILRKYLHFAKQKQPVLTSQAREFIALRYGEMRARQDDRTIPVTARSLETIIRLATAHAKARLSDAVLIEDCEAAMNILSFALYHEQSSSGDTTTVRRPAIVSDDGEESSSTDGGSSPKRLRLDQNVQTLKERIWSLLESSDEGTSLDHFRKMLDTTLPSLETAIEELQSEGRIEVQEGIVYSLS